MAKTKVDEWDTVPANNADIDGISILGTAPASNMDNALRELMAQVRATPLRESAPDMVTALGLGTAPLFYDDAATLFADTALTYSDVAAGQIIRTSADGFAYEVAASGATDHHVTTGAADVVKLTSSRKQMAIASMLSARLVEIWLLMNRRLRRRFQPPLPLAGTQFCSARKTTTLTIL